MKQKILHFGCVRRGNVNIITSCVCNDRRIMGKEWYSPKRRWALNDLNMTQFTRQGIMAGVAEVNKDNTYALCKTCLKKLEHIFAITALEGEGNTR
jgi:hypothetical protein